ncbi:CBS domain-containing protein [Paraglaciecola psychrophila]|uniref:CBS domain-containing membrane protein n=1 Tax=Paraglaciecola psychrophila 170 TaxID=1129794 RepID=K6ZK08_9ALTE|nr:CBS domain-containing protein [Paraglaciecola psychrophila]AGH44938.1 CBS domain-containing membrane protein [Paraglaciecola psychrophila 170]GAC36291.1 CBS domain protein [Paraglaciecola psychrophila 170]
MESLKVSDHMNQRPVTFTSNMTVAEAVERLLQTKQTGGPVIDTHKKVIGFLSEQDCLVHMIESSYYREQVAHVKDIMKIDVISIKPYTSVIDLAQKMMTEKPKVYPVVDDDGYLLGTINRSALLHAIDLQLHDGYRLRAS